MKVLFDTNVLLDVLLNRPPHAETAALLLGLVDGGALAGVLCATTITTIHYLAAKTVGRRQAKKHVRTLMAILEVAPVDHAVLTHALELDFPDFEDAVLHEAARAVGADSIVTRNRRDFARATLPVLDPVELLSILRGTAEN